MCKEKEDATCTTTTKAIAVVDPQVVGLQATGDYVYDRMGGNPLDNAFRIGKALALSKMFGVDSEMQGTVLALEAMHRNVSIMELASKYHVIKGRLSKRADAMQADFQTDRGRIKWIERTNKACEGIFSHPDYCPEGLSIRFDLEDAKKAGLSGGNWAKHPRKMLHARCVSEGVRAVHPAIVVGVYTPEEVADFDDTPADNRPPPDAPRATERRTLPAVTRQEPKPAAKVERAPEPEPIDAKIEDPEAIAAELARVAADAKAHAERAEEQGIPNQAEAHGEIDPQADPGPPPEDPELNDDGTAEPDAGEPPADDEEPSPPADAANVAKSISWLAKFAITREQLETALGPVDGWTEAQLDKIRAARDAAKGKPAKTLPAFLKSQLGIG